MKDLAYSSTRIQQSLHTVILKHIEEVNPSIRTFRLTIPPSVGSIKVSLPASFFEEVSCARHAVSVENRPVLLEPIRLPHTFSPLSPLR